MRRLRSAGKGLLVGGGLFAWIAGAGAQASPASIEAVKAVFIFRFTQFVDWPPRAFSSPTAHLVIGVAGDERLRRALAEATKGETVENHPLEVRPIDAPAEAGECQVLYVAPDAEANFDLRALRDRPILTVGESASFSREGGMIRFVSGRNRLHLVINLHASRDASLAISTQLLRIAEILE